MVQLHVRLFKRVKMKLGYILGLFVSNTRPKMAVAAMAINGISCTYFYATATVNT